MTWPLLSRPALAASALALAFGWSYFDWRARLGWVVAGAGWTVAALGGGR